MRVTMKAAASTSRIRTTETPVSKPGSNDGLARGSVDGLVTSGSVDDPVDPGSVDDPVAPRSVVELSSSAHIQTDLFVYSFIS